MPQIVGDSLCGILQLLQDEKDKGKEVWRSSYVSLCTELALLRFYKDEVEIEKEPEDQLDLRYVTQIAAKDMKKKHEFCFEIMTIRKPSSCVLKAASAEEQEQWINAITNATNNPAAWKRLHEITSNQSANVNTISESKGQLLKSKKNVSLKHHVVGGVKLKSPIKLNDDSQHSDSDSDIIKERVKRDKDIGIDTNSTPKMTQDLFIRDNRNVIRTGFCFKQGEKIKNWKRRFFILDTVKLRYYRNEMDPQPLKTIYMWQVASVGKSNPIHGRENLFKIETSNRIFYIQPDTDEEREDWIRAVKSVMYRENLRRRSSSLDQLNVLSVQAKFGSKNQLTSFIKGASKSMKS